MVGHSIKMLSLPSVSLTEMPYPIHCYQLYILDDMLVYNIWKIWQVVEEYGKWNVNLVTANRYGNLTNIVVLIFASKFTSKQVMNMASGRWIWQQLNMWQISKDYSFQCGKERVNMAKACVSTGALPICFQDIDEN